MPQLRRPARRPHLHRVLRALGDARLRLRAGLSGAGAAARPSDEGLPRASTGAGHGGRHALRAALQKARGARDADLPHPAHLLPAADGRPRYDAGEVDAVCFVPATAAAFARRGFDHMELVARELCRLTGLPLADVLVRRRARDQRELGQAERAANLAGTVEVADDVSGMRLLLLDDVVTTGSTIREASRALLARGACPPTACALARVW